MKRYLLVPAFAVMGLAVSAPASAQLGWPDSKRPLYRDEVRQPLYQSRRVAYDTGYREGIKEGEKDGRRRDAFNFRDEGAWRNADKGYHRSFGDRGRYRQVFRDGFEAGYADGYRRYAPGYGYGNGPYARGRGIPRRAPVPYPTYPNRAPGVYRYPGAGGYGYESGYHPAYSAGVRDGYEKGREDARDRDRYDPLRHKWYRSGDRDYRREYGSREQYADVYRRAFREGYDRGYRENAFRR